MIVSCEEESREAGSIIILRKRKVSRSWNNICSAKGETLGRLFTEVLESIFLHLKSKTNSKKIGELKAGMRLKPTRPEESVVEEN